MPTQQISGTIYQMYDASGNNRRFPVTVVDGVLGLASYLQEQFSSLANLYMGINDVTLSGTVLTVKGVPVNLATVTDLSNYYTKNEADVRYLQLTGGTINAPSVNPLSLNNTTVSNNVYLTLKIQNSTKAELGYSAGYGAYLQNGVAPNHTVWLLDTGVLKFNDNTVLHSGNYSSYALPLSGGTMANTNVVTNLNADLLDGSHLSDILAMDITGNAKTATNPKSESKTGQEFMFRKTNVEWDAKSGVIKKIKGKTITWNQLVRNGNFEDAAGWLFDGNGSIVNNEATVVSTAGIAGAYRGDISIISGHKYFLSCYAKVSEIKPIRLYLGINDSNGVTVTPSDTNQYVLLYGIVQASVDTFIIQCNASLSVGETITIQKVRATDLTLAGLADLTAAQFEALYPDIYPYNPGTLKSNDADAVETTGVNQWDEEWESGSIDGNGDKTPAPNEIRTKNYNPCIAGATCYVKATELVIYFYDSNKTMLPFTGTGAYLNGLDITNGNTFVVPSGARFFRFRAPSYGTTYNHDICINISNPAINGQYFPYKKSRINLGLKNIKVVSPNVWDEEWEEGGLVGNTLNSKEYIPVLPSTAYFFHCDTGSTYPDYYFYDANKVQIGNAVPAEAENAFTTPAGCYYIKFRLNTSYGSTYKGDITINKNDPAFNGRYFPFGTLNLEGGLKGAGSVYDEIRDGKYIKSVGEVDLGSLNYSIEGTFGSGAFRASLPNDAHGGSSDVYQRSNIKCSKYKDTSTHGLSGDDKAVAMWGDSTTFLVKDTDYSSYTPEQVEEALSGVILYYQLAKEEVYDLAEPLPSVYPCDQFGTERVISPVSTTPSAPFCADIQYGAKSDDVANDLIGTRDAVQPLLDALQYDGQNHAWHLKGNLYADGFITAYGINGGARTAVIAPYVIESSNYSPSSMTVSLGTMTEAIAKYKQGYIVQAKGTGSSIIYTVTSIDESGSSPILYCNGGNFTVILEA